MPWQQNSQAWINQPVGVSFNDGTGKSGVLCGTDRSNLYLMEYLYQSQFAMKQYPLRTIRDVNPFPPCRRRPQPQPSPGPRPPSPPPPRPRPPVY